MKKKKSGDYALLHPRGTCHPSMVPANITHAGCVTLSAEHQMRGDPHCLQLLPGSPGIRRRGLRRSGSSPERDATSVFADGNLAQLFLPVCQGAWHRLEPAAPLCLRHPLAPRNLGGNRQQQGQRYQKPVALQGMRGAARATATTATTRARDSRCGQTSSLPGSCL